MSKIAYLILCHKDPVAVGDWVEAHLKTGNYAAVHFDANASDEDFYALKERFKGQKNVVFVDRLACGWGEWSLVEASISLLNAALSSFKRATHFFLVSGECVPIKPASYIQNALDEQSIDFIEAQDFNSGWIKTGMVEDRYAYRHFFNERKSRRLFYRSLAIQRILRLRRKAPVGLGMKIGSQWWCLRRRTAEAVIAYVNKNPKVVRFFKTVWIPDECFFQTIVAHLINDTQRADHPPTFLTFSDYGMPVVFHTDHLPYLKEQPRFFARKASAFQSDLRSKFIDHYLSEDSVVRLSDKGQRIYDFTVTAGREGRRFELANYTKGNSIGRDRVITIYSCKDWAMGRAIAQQASHVKGVAALGYIFQEEDANLPNLGGFERGVGKRAMHRRAFLRMIMDVLGTQEIILCVDPAFVEIFKDLEADRCKMRVLFVDIDLSDDFCAGHAYRTGLLESHDAKENPTIVRTMRHNLIAEKERLIELGLRDFTHLARGTDPDETLTKFKNFADIDRASADQILTDVGFKINEEEDAL